jgi:hypothetical protein
MVMDIDKTGRDREPLGLDHGRGPGPPDPADEPDRAAGDAHIPPKGRAPHPVVDHPASYEQVEVLACRASLEEEAGASG